MSLERASGVRPGGKETRGILEGEFSKGISVAFRFKKKI